MKPKIFYTILTSVFSLILIIFYKWLFSEDGFDNFGIQLFTISISYCIGFFISLILHYYKFYLDLPFVTDLIDEPKNPVYRLKEHHNDLYKIVKSEVGYYEPCENLIILFPPILLFRYKTMVDNEIEYIVSKEVLDTGVSLEEYYENEWREQNKKYFKEKEIERQKEELINDFNKEYKENFKK